MNSIFKQLINNDELKESTSPHKKVLTESTSIAKGVLSSSVGSKALNTKSNISISVHQTEPKIQCKLFKDRVFDSIDMPTEEFINFLPEKFLIDDETSNQLQVIANNEKCLHQNYDRHEAPSVGYYGIHKEHILNIIKEYENKFGCSNMELQNALIDGRIRKSTIPNGISKGKTRVISLYEKNIEENQTYFYLLFIDLYHLFVPSGHAGFDSTKNLTRTYNSYHTNTIPIHDILKTENFSWNISI